MMEPTQTLAVIALASLVTVEYGGWALLSYLTARPGLTGTQKQFFRAGHAHAGVLLVLALVYFRYLADTDFSRATRWVVGLVLLSGILVQSGGFFAHLAVGAPESPSVGTRLTRLGAVLIAAALVTLAIGVGKA
jgi:hypothetical protein